MLLCTSILLKVLLLLQTFFFMFVSSLRFPRDCWWRSFCASLGSWKIYYWHENSFSSRFQSTHNDCSSLFFVAIELAVRFPNKFLLSFFLSLFGWWYSHGSSSIVYFSALLLLENSVSILFICCSLWNLRTFCCLFIDSSPMINMNEMFNVAIISINAFNVAITFN